MGNSVGRPRSAPSDDPRVERDRARSREYARLHLAERRACRAQKREARLEAALRPCELCGTLLTGRADKRFCSQRCIEARPEARAKAREYSRTYVHPDPERLRVGHNKANRRYKAAHRGEEYWRNRSTYLARMRAQRLAAAMAFHSESYLNGAYAPKLTREQKLRLMAVQAASPIEAAIAQQKLGALYDQTA